MRSCASKLGLTCLSNSSRSFFKISRFWPLPISGKTAKEVFAVMFATQESPAKIVQTKGLLQVVEESTIARWCDEAIQENPKAVQEYKGGKERALGSLIGAVMKKSQGKANPQLVNELLKKALSG